MGGNGVDDHSLKLLEFDRVTSAVAAFAASAGAARALAAARPIADRARRAAEIARLAEAIRRTAEPGEWCAVGEGEPTRRLEDGFPEWRQAGLPLAVGAGADGEDR